MYLSLFEDKPNLEELGFKCKLLEGFSKSSIEIIPNLMVNGIKGCGKSTKIYAYLCSLFDNKVYNLKTHEYEFDKKKVVYKSSIYHIEVDIDELISNEKIFFNIFLKEYCVTRNIGLNIPKIVYLKNANKMSKLSMLFCRKLIESNYMSCRFIFETTSLSHMPDSLLSRFCVIRIPMPTINDIEIVFRSYLKTKKINLTKKNFNIIIEKCTISTNLNLKKIMGFIRYYSITNKHLDIYYDNYTCEILKILNSKNINFSNINKIKIIVQEMYINLVNLNETHQIIYKEIIKKYDFTNYNFLYDFIDLIVECDINMNKGNKNFVQFENFIIKLIILINKYYP